MRTGEPDTPLVVEDTETSPPSKEETRLRYIVHVALTAKRLHETSGAFTCAKLVAGLYGDSDDMIEAVDALADLGIIKALPGQEHKRVQSQVYVWVGL